MEPHKRFAANMRRLRLARELSQEALGYRAELHRTEAPLLEHGLREPRLSMIVRVAHAKVPLTELLEGIR